MSNKAEKNFEEALQRLEEIVNLLEAGNLSLDEALKLFEEGRNLISFGSKKLESAEKKLQVLKDADKSS